MKKLIKLKDKSIKVAIGVFTLLFILFSLFELGILSLQLSTIGLIVAIAAILIISIEITLVNVFSKGFQGFDMLSIVGGIAVVLLALSILLEFVGVANATLSSIRGVIYAIVAISFVIETIMR